MQSVSATEKAGGKASSGAAARGQLLRLYLSFCTEQRKAHTKAQNHETCDSLRRRKHERIGIVVAVVDLDMRCTFAFLTECGRVDLSKAHIGIIAERNTL